MSYWTANEDKLGRAEESAYLIRFLTQQVSNRIARGKTGSYVLNIDASWGEGKSFFMNGLFADLEEAGHPVILINAWRDDFSDDPLTAVVAEFDNFLNRFKSTNRTVKNRVRAAGKDLRRNIGKLTLLSAKGIAKRATTYVVGEAAGEVVNTAKELVSGDVGTIVDDATGAIIKFTDTKIDKFAESKLAQFNEAKTSLDNFQTSLGKAVLALTAKEFEPPFFILVDELDRCRPTYAIEMLERIKHLFEVENVVFVLATDTTQLANSIKAVYGSDFDSPLYLARFFDRSYMLAAANRSRMIEYYFRFSSLDVGKLKLAANGGILEFLRWVCERKNLEIRQIEKTIDLLEIITSTWEENVQIELALLLPMIVAFLRGNNLSSDDKIRLVFKEGESELLHDGINIFEVFRTVQQLSSSELSQVRTVMKNFYPDYHSNNISASERVGLDVILDEVEALGEIPRYPVFSTYAQRIRMAGRFIDQ